MKFQSDNIDPSYGEHSQKPDMTEEEYEEEKNNVLQLLKEMSANRKIIERETIEQSRSKYGLSTEEILLLLRILDALFAYAMTQHVIV